ncbi:MAG: hypothetical protein DWQ02_25690 [Bacteroidetes bacterium]|nr:MAG: hypothetical protein DWQ02_25690 [Bacteroidota bacterium]
MIIQSPRKKKTIYSDNKIPETKGLAGHKAAIIKMVHGGKEMLQKTLRNFIIPYIWDYPNKQVFSYSLNGLLYQEKPILQ